MPQDIDKILRFYARKDIQQMIVDLAKDREVAVRYGDGNFGKRPDILQYPSDVLEFARNGATSFHISEERWQNPLEIVTGMAKKDLDSLRIGWDCVLDIDSLYVGYSQIAAHLIVEALKFYGIKSCGVKFSGRHGFHIIIPFEAFPQEVAGRQIKDMFPEGPRMIAEFLSNMITEKLSERILSEQKLSEISAATEKQVKDLQTQEGKFNPFSVVGIDTILISPRHLFRSLYSINEKSWLVSVPVEPSRILSFKLSQAKTDSIDTGIKFFKKAAVDEARSLVIQAFDSSKRQSLLQRSTIVVRGKDYFEKESTEREFAANFDKTLLKEDHLPPCIRLLIGGVHDDGRKRALFVLMNYFNGLGFSHHEIKEKILQWNDRNYNKLREGYIMSQLNSLMKSKSSFLPPNCANEAYYKDIGVCKQDLFCQKIKNPLNYTLLKVRMEKENKRKPRRKPYSGN